MISIVIKEKIPYKRNVYKGFLVPGAGIEPALRRNTSLSRARLPIPPSRPFRTANISAVTVLFQIFFL